ncbi:MAG: tetratricopeptide repeat-containing sensor histidine kinase [Bacteroidales bacterium]|nr:tetratricopeptide repeat-containing sensor histidine kinase [Bacteroidales bacterium]
MKRMMVILFLLACWVCAAQEGAVDAYDVAEEQFYQGQYGQAIRTALEGLQQEPALSSEESAVELYSILGASYSRLGAFDKAADFFFRCYQYDKKEGNQEGMTSSLINLASMYVYAGKPELAEKRALEAIENEKPLGRPLKLAMAYGKACDVYHALKREETALEYANLAVSTARETEDAGAEAIRRSQRAYPLLAMNRYKEAEADLSFSENYFSQNGNRQSLAIVYFQLAGLYEKTSRNSLATSYYLKALDLARKLPDKPLEQKICNSLSAHIKKTAPDEAYELLSRSAQLQEEISKSESDNALELFNIEYETAKKEEQIARQERELRTEKQLTLVLIIVLSVLIVAAIITAITAYRSKKDREKLKQSNAQKDFLFKVISHDIMSPAIAMLRGIQMLRGHSVDGNLERDSEVLVQLERQAESEVELIDNVMRWARNKEESSSRDKARFDIVSLVMEAMEQYRGGALQKGISLELYSPADSIVVYSNRNHLLIALRNLLSNAIKFSHKGGRVSVRIQDSEDGTNLSVEDSGIGIPADKLDSIYNSESSFRRPGTVGEPSHGLGLAVSRDLVAAIGGSMVVRSVEGKGSVFTIHIPAGGGEGNG